MPYPLDEETLAGIAADFFVPFEIKVGTSINSTTPTTTATTRLRVKLSLPGF
jgi:hypothetical protein